jgi:predicted HTH domain antitoxin
MLRRGRPDSAIAPKLAAFLKFWLSGDSQRHPALTSNFYLDVKKQGLVPSMNPSAFPALHFSPCRVMNVSMVIEVPDTDLRGIAMTQAGLKIELAVALFEQDKLSLGKARELAGMTLVEFQRELALRQIPLHFDVEDLKQDVATLKAMGAL